MSSTGTAPTRPDEMFRRNRVGNKEAPAGANGSGHEQKDGSPMSSWTIANPKPAGGFSKEEHVGHLLVFVGAVGEEVAKYSGEGTQVAAHCNYLICIDCAVVLRRPDGVRRRRRAEGHRQRRNRRGPVSRSGRPAPVRSAPYLLDDPTDADVESVSAFLDKYAVKMPSGKIVVEQPDAHDDGSF